MEEFVFKKDYWDNNQTMLYKIVVYSKSKDLLGNNYYEEIANTSPGTHWQKIVEYLVKKAGINYE